MRDTADQTRPAARVIVVTIAAWVAVVLMGSSLVWTVISRAGDGVTGSSAPVLAGSDSIAPNPDRTSLGSPSPHHTGHRDHTKHQNHTSKPHTDQPSSSPKPSSSPSSSPSTPSGHHSKHHNGHSKPPTAPNPELRTWSGKAGSVTVSCTGSLIRLVSAQPNVGYRVEVDRGTREVQVVFQRTGEGAEVQITGVCSGGTPQLHSEFDD